jgi:hypothetical protein
LNFYNPLNPYDIIGTTPLFKTLWQLELDDQQKQTDMHQEAEIIVAPYLDNSPNYLCLDNTAHIKDPNGLCLFQRVDLRDKIK